MTECPFSPVAPGRSQVVVPAATAVIFRRAPDGGPPELLMVQRSSAMRFAGGAAVFPGGRVDPEDIALARELAPEADVVEAAARIAAIRETLEETGLAIALRDPVEVAEARAARELLLREKLLEPVLRAFGWQLDLDRLTLYAHWCPPHERAFDTRFFVTDIGTGAVDVAADATENTGLFWVAAQAALDMADRGELNIIFPTKRNLERLAQFATFADVLADVGRHPVRCIVPENIERDGEIWIQIPPGHGYPVIEESTATARRG